VLKGWKVCSPVTSTPKAKLPLPTCIGVEFEEAWRTGLNWERTCWRFIDAAVIEERANVARRGERICIVIIVGKSSESEKDVESIMTSQIIVFMPGIAT